MSTDHGFKFSSLKAASDAAKVINDKQSTKYCPLIKATCRKDCECYTMAEGFTTKEETHHVAEGYCSNAMFIGSVCSYG